jgi:hypothetical protein
LFAIGSVRAVEENGGPERENKWTVMLVMMMMMMKIIEVILVAVARRFG